MKIAVLGLGLMGMAMATRLQATGHRVCGWNRSGGKLPAAEKAGLEASTDADIMSNANILVLTLSDAAAIGHSLGHAAPLKDRLVIQMGTIGPDESRAIASRVEADGGRYLEAPVLGSIPEARSGTLIIMAGGRKEDFEAALPVLDALGTRPRLVGPTGQGAALKLAMNQLIAGLTSAFSASLGLVRAEGIETDLFMALLRESALYAPTFDKKLGKMLAHDYARPNFPLKHLLKDTRLFEAAAGASGSDTRVQAAMASLFEQGVEAGFGDEDYSALYEAVNPRRA
jgi:3-hydroxyisobutyrate dehydrogenase-like beta-hydroxyacid dehydrogenase